MNINDDKNRSDESCYLYIAITRRLKEAGELLGIRVLDHVIVGSDGICSFVERGLV